jgi:hypothetical protein
MADNLPPSPTPYLKIEEDNYDAKYPYNNVTETKSGHLQEFDDTPGAERIRTQHRTGTYSEIAPDGSEQCKIIGDSFEVVVKNKQVMIKGFCQVSIDGNSVLEVKGDCIQRVKGNFQQVVEGNYDLVVKGKTNISSVKNMSIGILNATGGKLKVLAGDALVVNSDLVVNGGVSAESLFSAGAVTAGTGIHAGLPNSVNPVAGITTLGGINAGPGVGAPPTPTVPGVINASVIVTAPAVIGTTITFGAILMDPFGGAPMIRTIYDGHTHPVVSKDFGLTGVPIQPMPLP